MRRTPLPDDAVVKVKEGVRGDEFTMTAGELRAKHPIWLQDHLVFVDGEWKRAGIFGGTK